MSKVSFLRAHLSSQEFVLSDWFLKVPAKVPVPRWVGDNTDLPSNSNISKTIRVNIAFTWTVFKEHLISFVMVCWLIDFVLLVLKLLMFKASEIIGIS